MSVLVLIAAVVLFSGDSGKISRIYRNLRDQAKKAEKERDKELESLNKEKEKESERIDKDKDETIKEIHEVYKKEIEEMKNENKERYEELRDNPGLLLDALRKHLGER